MVCPLLQLPPCRQALSFIHNQKPCITKAMILALLQDSHLLKELDMVGHAISTSAHRSASTRPAKHVVEALQGS